MNDQAYNLGHDVMEKTDIATNISTIRDNVTAKR